MKVLTREQIAKRISKEIPQGSVVNLGIGIPTLVANFIEPERQVLLHSENGLLGMGPFPFENEVDPDLINAGKQTVTAVSGSSFFDSAQSFAMIRGGHVDVTVLGAMEVDAFGNIANWMIPGKMVKGMGGAMDLVAGVKRIVVAMQQVSKNGESKLLARCGLPLTGVSCVKEVFTEMGFYRILDGVFVLEEHAPELDPDWILSQVAGPSRVSESIKPIEI